MKLYSTRDKNAKTATFSEAILNPAAGENALFAPIEFPNLGDLNALKKLNYRELTEKIFALFSADIDAATLSEALKTYDRFDDPDDPAPLKRLLDDTFLLELWRGPTRAFKDMALQPFGAILSALAQKRGEKFLILAATSGDTGPATLETFANRANTEAVCIFPDGGTSEVQKLQMISAAAPNLLTIAIKGSFDDAQSALKNLLASESFNAAVKRSGRSLSSANSVNIGRVIFQIIYHIRAYLTLLDRGEIKVGEAASVIVPSGNFGNALGAYYARKMGLPIAKIIVASNDNNILTDLIATGRYDISRRKLIATISPAMDILKSSNVERLLFDLFGDRRARELMSDLAAKNSFVLTAAEHEAIREIFDAAWSNEREVLSAMRESLARGYIIDPHTATCMKAAKIAPTRVKVLCSTAEWTKFAPSLAIAAGIKNCEKIGDLEALNEISARFDAKIPQSIKALFAKDHVAPTVIAPNEIEAAILKWLDR
ncbi:MAG: threonine synthase [Helicobacteraceae bacterium]|jgi:threonine synthase|nr:threonine synthase [Helicobacteraceae bacterium]